MQNSLSGNYLKQNFFQASGQTGKTVVGEAVASAEQAPLAATTSERKMQQDVENAESAEGDASENEAGFRLSTSIMCIGSSDPLSGRRGFEQGATMQTASFCWQRSIRRSRATGASLFVLSYHSSFRCCSIVPVTCGTLALFYQYLFKSPASRIHRMPDRLHTSRFGRLCSGIVKKSSIHSFGLLLHHAS